MKQLRISAVYMRGGTSKGVFILAADLRSDAWGRVPGSTSGNESGSRP